MLTTKVILILKDQVQKSILKGKGSSASLLILSFMISCANKRPRQQESLMEKILQMCSDWNLDQPTFGKFPVLELFRHATVGGS